MHPRHLLQRYGLHPKKGLGQNFLVEAAALRRIVAAADLTELDTVLEIGPGLGALTRHLAAAAGRVVAVELDDRFIPVLTEELAGVSNVELVEGDILALDPSALAGGPYKVVANLPYYLSTPLLFRMAGCRRWFSRLLLMVQDEVAARMAASPQEGKTYGSLSVAIQHAFTVRRVLRVPPGAFRPPPKVDSAVVELRPRLPVLAPSGEAWFFEHVKRLFSRRRKLMLSGLREAGQSLPPERWQALELLVGERRAETLTPDEHLRVFQLLHTPP